TAAADAGRLRCNSVRGGCGARRTSGRRRIGPNPPRACSDWMLYRLFFRSGNKGKVGGGSRRPLQRESSAEPVSSIELPVSPRGGSLRNGVNDSWSPPALDSPRD